MTTCKRHGPDCMPGLHSGIAVTDCPRCPSDTAEIDDMIEDESHILIQTVVRCVVCDTVYTFDHRR